MPKIEFVRIERGVANDGGDERNIEVEVPSRTR
jgi:hypothetical protein